MGQLIDAKCECGYEERDIPLGYGKIREDDRIYFPGLCEFCRAVVAVRFLNEEVRCCRCNALNPKVYDHGGDGVATYWRFPDGEKILPAEGGECPKCGNDTLSFSISQHWD